jgi:hypothetical protein
MLRHGEYFLTRHHHLIKLEYYACQMNMACP